MAEFGRNFLLVLSWILGLISVSLSEESEIIEGIKTQVLTLEDESFTGDFQLIQKGDKINGDTTYSTPGGKVLFNRRSYDTGQKVIILTHEQDHLHHNANNKRVYIILRENPNQPSNYYIFYAYLRETKGDNSLGVRIGNWKKILEYDVWIGGRGVDKNVGETFGWTSCFHSLIPPCKLQIEKNLTEGEEELPTSGSYSQSNDEPEPKSSLNETNESSYYSLLGDLDYSPFESEYVSKNVAVYVYSLSAATSIASPEALVLAGIQPSEQPSSQSSSTKLEDMKLAVDLFQKTINETIPLESLPIKVSGRSMGGDKPKVDMERFKRLKEQYISLIDKLDSVAKVFPKKDSPTDKIPDPTGSEEPHEQLNMYKSKGVNLVSRVGEKGMAVVDGILELSEVGQELKDNPVEGQDLLNEIDPESLKEESNGADEREEEVDPQKVKERLEKEGRKKALEEKIRQEKKKQRELKSKAKALKKENEEKLKKKGAADPPKGGLLSGGLLGLLLGPQGLVGGLLGGGGGSKKGRSISDPKQSVISLGRMIAKGNAPILTTLGGALLSGEEGTAHILNTLGEGESNKPLGRSLIEGTGGQVGGAAALNIINNLADNLLKDDKTLPIKISGRRMKTEDLREFNDVATPVVDAVNSDGSVSTVRLVVNVAGTVIDEGLRMIPIVGAPIAAAAGLLGRAAKGALSFFGFGGRSFPLQDGKIDTNLFGSIGWRSGDINSQELSTLAPNIEGESPFLAFGNCPLKQVKLTDFEGKKTDEEIIELYTQILRTQCSEGAKKTFAKLLSSSLLKVNGDNSLAINPASPLIKESKLKRKDLIELLSAFEMSIFSQNILSKWREGTKGDLTNPDGSKITRSIHTFIHFGLAGLEEGRKSLPIHFIKIARHLIITLKTGFTKSLQDYDRYKACSKCQGELLKIAQSDLLAIQSLIQFIILKSESIELSDQPVTSLYNQFFIQNKSLFQLKLSPFL